MTHASLLNEIGRFAECSEIGENILRGTLHITDPAELGNRNYTILSDVFKAFEFSL